MKGLTLINTAMGIYGPHFCCLQCDNEILLDGVDCLEDVRKTHSEEINYKAAVGKRK